MHECDIKPKFYGSASIGERGQIVIPAELRSELNISAGDKFIFFSNGKMINLIKADEAQKMIEHLEELLKFKENLFK